MDGVKEASTAPVGKVSQREHSLSPDEREHYALQTDHVHKWASMLASKRIASVIARANLGQYWSDVRKLHISGVHAMSPFISALKREAASPNNFREGKSFFSFKRFSRVDYSAGATHSTVGRAATGARQTTTAAIRSSGRLLRPQKEGQAPITLDFMYIRERDSCGLCIIIYTVKGRIIGTPRYPLVSSGAVLVIRHHSFPHPTQRLVVARVGSVSQVIDSRMKFIGRLIGLIDSVYEGTESISLLTSPD